MKKSTSAWEAACVIIIDAQILSGFAPPPFVVSKYAESPTGYKHDHSEIDAGQERPGRMQQNRVQPRINGPMFSMIFLYLILSGD